MFEKQIISFNTPFTNLISYGYSIFKDSIIQKTIYYKSSGVSMTEEEANSMADAEIEALQSVSEV